MSAFAAMNSGIGVESLEERLEPLGCVGRLELGQLRQELLRSAHLVDDAQLVEALVVLLDAQLGDDDEHVAGDPLLGGQALDRDRACLGGGPVQEVARLGATGRARVLEAVGVAVVAVERGDRRIELENGLPEPFREVVDGRAGRLGVDTMKPPAVGRSEGQRPRQAAIRTQGSARPGRTDVS